MNIVVFIDQGEMTSTSYFIILIFYFNKNLFLNDAVEMPLFSTFNIKISMA